MCLLHSGCKSPTKEGHLLLVEQLIALLSSAKCPQLNSQWSVLSARLAQVARGDRLWRQIMASATTGELEFEFNFKID